MMADKVKIYLAGPMRGYFRLNFPRFNQEAQKLRDRGYWVFNPAEDDLGDPQASIKDYLIRDLPELLRCDKVVVLSGWRQSEGASCEVMVAAHLGMEILDPSLEPLDVRVLTWSTSAPGPQKLNVLQEAMDLVGGARRSDYGHPLDDFSRTAQIWGAILKCPVSPSQVALCMIGLKMSRECNGPKRDNIVDIGGYALCHDMVLQEQERRAEQGRAFIQGQIKLAELEKKLEEHDAKETETDGTG